MAPTEGRIHLRPGSPHNRSARLGAAAIIAVGLIQGAPPASAKVCDGAAVVCAIGDTGPGGGIVFYDAGTRQPWGRYLEAAPAGWVDSPVTPSPVMPAQAPGSGAEQGAASVVPGVPRQVKVTVRQGGATVSWQPPVDASGELRYVVTTEPSSKGCRTAKKSCTVNGLVPGRQYAFSVLVLTDAGQGEPTAAVQARIPARPQPAPSEKPAPVLRAARATLPMAADDPSAPWCAQDSAGFATTLPTNYEIGTGRANTGIIVQACGAGSAAGRAASYRGGGKADWFLPSKDELDQLYAQRALVGGLGDGTFWTSSQNRAFAPAAWCRTFGSGSQGDNYKDNGGRVRPVRAF